MLWWESELSLGDTLGGSLKCLRNYGCAVYRTCGVKLVLPCTGDGDCTVARGITVRGRVFTARPWGVQCNVWGLAVPQGFGVEPSQRLQGIQSSILTAQLYPTRYEYVVRKTQNMQYYISYHEIHKFEVLHEYEVLLEKTCKKGWHWKFIPEYTFLLMCLRWREDVVLLKNIFWWRKYSFSTGKKTYSSLYSFSHRHGFLDCMLFSCCECKWPAQEKKTLRENIGVWWVHVWLLMKFQAIVVENFFPGAIHRGPVRFEEVVSMTFKYSGVTFTQFSSTGHFELDTRTLRVRACMNGHVLHSNRVEMQVKCVVWCKSTAEQLF